MALLDLVRPQWKHSDPEKRAEAVRLLEEDRQEVFADAVGDDDARVRLAAAKRIAGEDRLRKVAAESGDEAVREVVQRALVKIVVARARAAADAAPAEAELWIRELSVWSGGEKAVEDAAVNARAVTVRRAALATLTHASAVAAVAQKETDHTLAREALARVTRETHLEAVAKSAASREARAAAKERLKALEAAKKPDEVTLNRARLEILVMTAEKADAASAAPDASFDWDAAAARVEDAAEALDELVRGGLAVAGDLRARFDAGVAAFRDRYSAHVLAERTRLVHEEEAARVRAVGEELCERLEALSAASPDAEDALRDLSSQFKAAGADAPDGDPALRERFRLARERLVAALKEMREKKEKTARSAREEGTARDEERDEARAAAREEKAARRAEDAAAATTALETAARDLEALAASNELSGDLKTADRKLREARAEAKRCAALVDPTSLAAFHTAADTLHEMLEWNRWANLQRKREICDTLEALRDAMPPPAPDESDSNGGGDGDSADLRAAFARFKDLLADWKRTGPVPWDEADALWERHHAVADALYERFRAFLAEREEEREANLRAKEELCARLEALLNDSDAEPREVGEAFREAHATWKSLGAVPREKREQADALWDRFKAVTKAYHARRDETAKKNLDARRALAERAEALRDSTAWKDTAEELKRLQEEWKDIGFVPREKRDRGEALWNRFRAACDVFFEARKAHFAERDAARAENLTKKTALCEAMEALDALPDDEARHARILELQAEWKSVGPVPRDKDEALWNRFRAPADAFFGARAAHSAQVAAVRERRDEGLSIREDIITEADGLGTLDRHEAVEKVKTLQAEWRAAPPVARHQEQLLWLRFRQACDAYFGGDGR